MPDVIKRLAKLLKIAAIAGIAAGIVRAVGGSKPPEVTGQASWQPLAETPATTKRTGPVRFTAPASGPADAETETAADAAWVAPVDGVCPASHPIKGNSDSGIFHVPGGMSYDRTVPERCYASETAAESDGFRKAKR